MTSTTADPLALTLTTSQIVPLWIYCFLILVLGVIGNLLVIYSTFRYNSIRLDRISLLLVQNLAIADFIYVILITLPVLVTYSAGGWVLGEGWCWAMSQLTFIPGTVNTLTVLAITLNRLRTIMSGNCYVSVVAGRVLIVCIWIISLLGTIISLSYASSSVFSPTAARCNSSIYRDPEGGPVFIVAATGLLIIVPVLLITLGNIIIGLTFLAPSSTHSTWDRREGIATVIAISVLFIASWTPLILFTFYRIRRRKPVPSHLDLLAFHFIFLNIAGNPILYMITNKRFWVYVSTKNRVVRALCCKKKEDHQHQTREVVVELGQF